MIPDTLRDIYRLLKMVLSSETDDVIKLHADNALNILDDIIKESCSLQPQLVKKIQIISWTRICVATFYERKNIFNYDVFEYFHNIINTHPTF